MRIAGTEDRTFSVKASIQEVYRFFAEPDQLRELVEGVESLQSLGDGRVRWVLKEKVDKGIRFKGDYTVTYQGNGSDHVRWSFVEGNMGDEGDVWLKSLSGGGTEVRYRETVEPDLPITPIMGRLLKPIVMRELRGDVGRFLERVVERFGAA